MGFGAGARLQPRYGPGAPPQTAAPPLGWDMGIGAGARLRQQILKDPHAANTWDKSASVLVNVQILNSVAFESLTGMLAPPTPITPESYIKAGFPFYLSYGEAAETYGGTNFQAIKSIGQLDAMSDKIKLDTSVATFRNVGCTICQRNFVNCM